MKDLNNSIKIKDNNHMIVNKVKNMRINIKIILISTKNKIITTTIKKDGIIKLEQILLHWIKVLETLKVNYNY